MSINQPSRREARPNYREAGETYLADNCQPLIEAARAGRVAMHALSRAGYPGRQIGARQLPGLRSVGYWDAGPNQNWGLPPHRNEGIEISFLASGRTSVAIEGKRTLLSHDELMITRPWQPHQIGNPHIAACKLIWLIIDVGVRRPHQPWNWPDWIVLDRPDREMLTRYLRQNEQLVWPASSEICRCFRSIAQDLETGGDNMISRMAVGINGLLLALLGGFQQRNIPLRATLASAERTILLFLEELNATLDQPWTLESMAESCHLGVTQFVHYFRCQTNLTPAKFLNHARIQKACGMLARESAASITDIGFACGFSSSQYFTNVFRHQMGCPPREYRARRLSFS
ncbi:MAG: AraC family transcriptional regulator [Verrucomicrobiae bacterium]